MQENIQIQIIINPRGMNLRAAAAYLGTTRKQIQLMVWGHELRVAKLGKSYIVDVRDLDAILETKKKFL
jgi:Helix-turn-helix domain